MQILSTPHAPAAIGPYSQAIATGDYIFLSGQIALDPVSMMLIQDSLEDEVEQIIKNITAILESGGFSREHIVKTTIFLTDMSDFGKVNEIYGKYFPHKPARSTV